MAFSPQFLDEVRARISLASVVGRHVRLTKRGREYIGLCPFHKEKTPSFNVVEEKGFYHCFGCGAHGDVIGFSMRASNLSFREAVVSLAKEAGLEIPEDTPHDRERAARAATLYDVCEAAAQYFEHQLNNPRATQARAYLQKRGITPDLIRRFRLGYAPSGNAPLLHDLSGRFSEAMLLEAGLVRADENGRRYDFFRDRVMFPIADRQGRVVAFGARTLGDGQPKYLNSPDTPVFQKGRTLYAFHIARKVISRERAPIVAEGYMDVIALHGAGFETAVAPLGTALTEQQLAELWKLSPEPLLCFDGDAAGLRAADRAVDRALPLIRGDISLKIMTLPPGEDPDSLIQAGGAAQFRLILKSARVISEYLWTSATRGKDFSTVEKVLQLEHSLLQKVFRVEDKRAQFFLRQYVNNKVWEFWKKATKRDQKKERIQFNEDIERWLDELAVREKIQIVLLALALSHPGLARSEIDQFAQLMPRRSELRELHHTILELMATTPDISAEDLQLRLNERGFGKTLNRIFNSDIYRARRFGTPAWDDNTATTGWHAAFSRYVLPELQEQLEEAKAAWVENPTEENQGTMLMYRQLVEEQNTEAVLVREKWDSAERLGEWRPAAAA